MKAEHRKELETNALADRMGRLIGNLKEKPKRGTVFWVFAGVLIVVAVFMSVRWYRVGKDENSEGWFSYYIFTVNAEGKSVLDSHLEKPQGQAVRFEYAWELLWGNLRKMGADPRGAKDGINKARELYEGLAKECEKDPVWEPEAMYGLAVIQETMALENIKNLTTAIEQYEELAKKHKDSAFGQLAATRAELLNSETGGREVRELYVELGNVIGFDRFNRLDGLLDGLKDKKK